jgi:hypothetical protein
VGVTARAGGSVDLTCGGSNDALEAIPGETIPRGTGSGGFGSYGAGPFEHSHVPLRAAPGKVGRVRNLIKGHCVFEIARFSQNSEYPENDYGLTFLHAPLRSLVLRDSLVRQAQARSEYFGRHGRSSMAHRSKSGRCA